MEQYEEIAFSSDEKKVKAIQAENKGRLLAKQCCYFSCRVCSSLSPLLHEQQVTLLRKSFWNTQIDENFWKEIFLS